MTVKHRSYCSLIAIFWQNLFSKAAFAMSNRCQGSCLIVSEPKTWRIIWDTSTHHEGALLPESGSWSNCYIDHVFPLEGPDDKLLGSTTWNWNLMGHYLRFWSVPQCCLALLPLESQHFFCKEVRRLFLDRLKSWASHLQMQHKAQMNADIVAWGVLQWSDWLNTSTSTCTLALQSVWCYLGRAKRNYQCRRG